MDRSVTQGTTTKATDQNYSIKAAGDAAYTITDADKFDEINVAPATARTITLPTVGDNTGRIIIIYNSTGTDIATVAAETSTESIILSGGGSVETFGLMQENDFLIIRSDGSNWLKQNPPYWHKFVDPATGFTITKTSGWSADSFTGGLEATFSVSPIGSLAVWIVAAQASTLNNVWWRKSGDSNISNTPSTTLETSHQIFTGTYDFANVIVWMSTDLKTQFAVGNTGVDLSIAAPMQYLQ